MPFRPPADRKLATRCANTIAQWLTVQENLKGHVGAPARLRGLVPAWRLARPRHRGQSGREITFWRSPHTAMIAG
jgi:hypothetical protein